MRCKTRDSGGMPSHLVTRHLPTTPRRPRLVIDIFSSYLVIDTSPHRRNLSPSRPRPRPSELCKHAPPAPILLHLRPSLPPHCHRNPLVDGGHDAGGRGGGCGAAGAGHLSTADIMISHTRRTRSSSSSLPIFHTTLSPDRIILASSSRCPAHPPTARLSRPHHLGLQLPLPIERRTAAVNVRTQEAAAAAISIECAAPTVSNRRVQRRP